MKKIIFLFLFFVNAGFVNAIAVYSGTGSGSGDVIAPASNTDSYVPQWDGTNSKKFIDGFPISAQGKTFVNLSSTANMRINLGINTITENFSFGIDGGTSVPSTGNLTSTYMVPITCTATTWYISSNVTGNAVIDIKRNGESIIGAGNKPTLTNDVKNTAEISSWTSTILTEGDRLTFALDSIATANAVTVLIKTTR